MGHGASQNGTASLEIEEAIEALGLFLIGLWMTVLAGTGWRRRSERTRAHSIQGTTAGSFFLQPAA